MKWVVLGIFAWLVLLAAMVLTGCAGSRTTHNSRVSTCLGFCTDTEVKHTTEKPATVEKSL